MTENPRLFAGAPDGDVAGWRSRLKELFGTASPLFVEASLRQLIEASKLPGQGVASASLSFDPFSFDQNCLAAAEVDVSRRQIADTLVIAPVIVVSDEGLDLGFEIAREVLVFEQDTIPIAAVTAI